MDLGPRPVWILGAVFLLDLLLVLLLYKEMVISSFDPGMAVSVGISAGLVHYLLMGAVSLTTVAAFESVGAILVVAMFIVPGAAAYLWSDKLKTILILAVIFGVFSSIGGYLLASKWDSSIAGAIVTTTGIIFFFSMLFSPAHGVLGKVWGQLKLSSRVAQDHILLAMIRRSEQLVCNTLSCEEAVAEAGVWKALAAAALNNLRQKGLIKRIDETLELTDSGRLEAVKLIRSHRLWEGLLSELGLPEDHLHQPAHEVEHFLDDELREQVSRELPDSKKDPHGKDIPE